MRNYLSFLKDFQVQSKLTLDVFLQKANLTPLEKETLREHLDELELLYKVTFQGKGEMLVFRARLKKWDDEHIEVSVAAIIARSMPYDVLVGVQNGNAVRFIVTDRRDNKINSRKSMMERCCSFPSVLPGRNADIDIAVQKTIKNAFLTSKSPAEVVAHLQTAYSTLWKERNKRHLEKLLEAGIVEVNDYPFGPAYSVKHDEEIDVLSEMNDTEYMKNTFANDWKITGA